MRKTFRGIPIEGDVYWVVCCKMGQKEEAWVPLMRTIQYTRSESIDAYGRLEYHRHRSRGEALCMLCHVRPYPHCQSDG